MSDELTEAVLRNLPECPNYAAHPQAVWFEEHWRPIIRTLLKINAEMAEYLRCIRDNYDCDDDAHEYKTSCRSCDAQEALLNRTTQMEKLGE